MTVVIAPDFSVFELVKRSRQTSITLDHRRTMQLLSHKIEKRLLQENVQGNFYVGFQTASRFLKQQKTYAQLGLKFNRVYVFAYPDVPFPTLEKITFIPLKAKDKLTEEWFLIFHGLTYFTALAAQETPQPNGAENLFAAQWTFNLDIIKILHDWLSSAIDTQVQHYPETAYNLEAQGRIMDLNIEDLLTTQTDAQTAQEIQQTIETTRS